MIELIVVIAIIGLLASVVMTSLSVSRTRAEVARVLTDYKSVANAFELYRQSHAGSYPGNMNDPVDIQDLVGSGGPLSEYMKQVPSVSTAVTSSGSVLYWLNDSDQSQPQYWCGDTGSRQDYVLYFSPTQAATDSGYFKAVSSGIPGGSTSVVAGVLCIPVNQK